MKLFIDGKHREVGFWSFLKCNFLTSLVLGLIIWILTAIMFAMIGVSLG